MDERIHLTLRIAVSGYLIYLAWQIVTDQMAGKSAMGDALAYGAAAVMALAGVGFAVYSLMGYFRHKNRGEAPLGEGEEKGNDQGE